MVLEDLKCCGRPVAQCDREMSVLRTQRAFKVFVLACRSPPTRASFEWRITHYIKPLERLKDLGLVFVEISLPLLVTGLVI